LIKETTEAFRGWNTSQTWQTGIDWLYWPLHSPTSLLLVCHISLY